MGDNVDQVRNGARRVGIDVEQGADRIKRTASSELSNLIADVEDLVKRVAHVSDVDVARIRDRVQEKIGSAKETLAVGGKRIGESARAAAGATDDYVRGSPWQSMGLAALAGVAIGYLLSTRR
jgi:ElaB/YqjD/DUF883 family membrane-anchored ribosome-binding protein